MLDKILGKKNTHKYTELRSQELRKLEDFLNTYIETFVRDVELHQERYAKEVEAFKEGVRSLDPLDSPEESSDKMGKLIQSLNTLDFPLRSNFYYELIDRFNFSPLIGQIGDEIFQRVLLKLGAGDEYEKFSMKMQETVDKVRQITESEPGKEQTNG